MAHLRFSNCALFWSIFGRFWLFGVVFWDNLFLEISDDFYALKLLFLPFFDQTIRNSQKMSIAFFQLFERNHYVPKALWYYSLSYQNDVINEMIRKLPIKNCYHLIRYMIRYY